MQIFMCPLRPLTGGGFTRLSYGSIPLVEQAGQTLPAALSGSSFVGWISADHLPWLGRASVMLFGFVAGATSSYGGRTLI